MKKSCLFLVSCVALIATLLSPAFADPPPARNFLAPRLDGAQEFPLPRLTPARGVAVFNLSPDGTLLRFHLVVTRIENVVGAHIHSGQAGANGPIVFGMFGGPPGGGGFNGVLTQGTIVRGVTPLPTSLGLTNTLSQRFDELVRLMRTGNTYVNVHTNDGIVPTNTGSGDFPGGEIRSQIIPRP